MKYSSRLFSSITSILVKHFNVFYRHLDPVQSSTESTPQSESRKHFLASILISLFTVLYGIFGLQYEATGSLRLADLASSPFIYIHQICPRSIWPQIEFSIGWVDSATTLLLLAALMITTEVKEHFRFYLTSVSKTGQRQSSPLLTFNGSPLRGEQTARLLKARRQILYSNIGVMLYFNVIVDGYFLGNVWWNDVYPRSLNSLLYWLFLFPLFIGYLLYVIVGFISYIVLAVYYIAIRQQVLLHDFLKLNRSVLGAKERNFRHWTAFCTLNQKLTVICRSVKEYSRYCGSFLSLFFPFCIVNQCYFGYIVAFANLDQASARWLFTSSLVECNIILFALTNRCAVIVKLNGAFERHCRTFVFSYHRKPAAFLNVRELVKADLFVVPKSLQPYAFKVFVMYRISSKTYYMICSYIFIFFLYVLKQNFYKQQENSN